MQPTLEDDSLAPSDEFAALWALADTVPGWLTLEQGRALWEAVRQLPMHSTVVEIGSHQGRSTIVLAGARPDVNVVAVDPHLAGGRFGGNDSAVRLHANLRRAALQHRVRHVPLHSRTARRDWTGPIAMLYIDGKHDYWTVRDDLRWTELVDTEGIVMIHDVHGSVGVTFALLVDSVGRRSVSYVDRWGSLARFRPTPPVAAERRALYAGLPWFARNVGLKLLLRARLHAVAARLGHDGPDDPY